MVLGIKKYKGVAIDLWCGAPEEFESDVRLVDTQVSLTDQAWLEAAERRHLTILVSDLERARREEFWTQQFSSLCQQIDQLHLSSSFALGRITFILPDEELYFYAQEQLWNWFR